MKGSLFDQLKNVGLVDKQKAKQVKKAQYQQAKQKKSQRRKQVDEVSEAAKLVAEAEAKKAEHDRLLNVERQQQQAAKTAKIELNQLIQSNRITGYEGDLTYHYVEGKVVKTLQVNRLNRAALVAGRIRLTKFEEGVVLVSDEVAEKIAQRDASVLIPLAKEDESVSDEDGDYYAQFEIPDDLIW